MSENENVKTTIDEQSPRKPFGGIDDLNGTIDELQKQLKTRIDERDECKTALSEIKEIYFQWSRGSRTHKEALHEIATVAWKAVGK